MDELVLRIESFLESTETINFIPLKDSVDPTGKLNYPNLFFKFNTIKEYNELIVSKFELFFEFEDVKKYINEFMMSDKHVDSIKIHNSLRKPIRQLKNLYPGLYYFAKHTTKIYELILSKNKLEISFNELDYNTRKMFVEYSGLKIDPNIDQQTFDLLNKNMKLDEKFRELSDLLLKIGCEKDFINNHYSVINAIVDFLNKSTKYQDWVNYVPIIHIPKIITRNVNVYQENNDNLYFISIDLKSANYQILNLNGLIDDSWEIFISQFTPYCYYHKSKLLRLKSLSHSSLQPKKQQQIWKHIIIEVLNAMITDNIVLPNIIAARNNDEIIIKTNSENMEHQLQIYRNYLSVKFPHLTFSLDLFQLKKIGKHYTKINPFTQKVSFKCVNAKEIPGLITTFNELKLCAD